MNFAPSEEQAMVCDMLRRFLSDRGESAGLAHGPMPKADWLALGELGLFAFLLPESMGGMGGAAKDVMLAAEAFGTALAITPLAQGVVMAGALIGAGASGESAGHWGEAIASGEATFGYAQGGRRQDRRVTGKIGLVRDGMTASGFLLQLESGELALIEADAPGVQRTPVRLADGSLAANLEVGDAKAEFLSHASGDFERAHALASIAASAELVGTMETLLGLTVDYVRQRLQFGKPIGSFQVIQHRCARLYISLEQARSLLLRAALSDAGQFVRNSAMASAFIAEAAQGLAEDAVQLHGGMGVTDELAVGRALRRVLVLTRSDGGAATGWDRLALQDAA